MQERSAPVEVERIGPTPFRWTPAEYNRAAEAGFFNDQRVELIRGRILYMSPIGPDHTVASTKARYRLGDHFKEQDGFIIGTQIPLRLEDSEPEPDLFVFRGTVDDEAGGDNEVVLVLEAAKSSLTFDRGTKLSLYAENGYLDYWILNLVDNVLEVYRNPIQSNGTWTYADKTTISVDGTISPLAKPEAVIRVADLLPRQ